MFNTAIKKSLRLYEEVKESNTDAAHDILKNLFCRHPENIICFTKYFDHCIENAKSTEDVSRKQIWLEEATLSLNVFIEKVRYSYQVIELIDSCRNSINEIGNSLFYEKPSEEPIVEDNENDNVIERVITLFNKTKKADKDFALLIVKNLFSGNIADKRCFLLYFDYCLSLASEHNVPNDIRDSYMHMADIALQMFAEKTHCDEDSLHLIKEKLTSLNKAKNTADLEYRNNLLLHEEQNHREIGKNLASLSSLIDAVQIIKSRKELDEIVESISSVESSLDKDAFNEKELNEYNLLSKKLSDILPKKLDTFKKMEERDFNNEAIEIIKQSFDLFTNDEKKYKKIDDAFKSDIAEKMFSLDSSRMSAETYSYYNFVYGYMFGKLDNENKYNLTLLALQYSK